MAKPNPFNSPEADRQVDIENYFNPLLRITALVAVVFSINKDFKKRGSFDT